MLGDFQPTPVESDGPLACTGSFWRTQFHVQCVLDAPQTEIIAVTVNETDHCNVHIFMTSAAACTKFTLSGGWMFIGALAAVTFAYAAAGLLWNVCVRGQLQYPHSSTWRWLGGLVYDGQWVVQRALSKGLATCCLACCCVPVTADEARERQFLHASRDSSFELGGLQPSRRRAVRTAHPIVRARQPSLTARFDSWRAWAVHWQDADVVPWEVKQREKQPPGSGTAGMGRGEAQGVLGMSPLHAPVDSAAEWDVNSLVPDDDSEFSSDEALTEDRSSSEDEAILPDVWEEGV